MRGLILLKEENRYLENCESKYPKCLLLYHLLLQRLHTENYTPPASTPIEKLRIPKSKLSIKALKRTLCTRNRPGKLKKLCRI